MSKRPTPARQPSSRPATSTPTKGINGWVVATIVVAVVVVAGVIAVVANSGSGSDSSDGTTLEGSSETQPVTVTGDPLPGFEDTTPDPAVGMQAPVLSGSSFDGTPITIGTPGKPSLVIFLAHWCPHCQREVPRLVEWEKAGQVPEGIDVYGVATATSTSRPNYPPSAWLAREGFTFPVMADSPDFTAAQAYGLTGYPYFVLLDKDGKVLARASGEIEIDALNQLLASVTA